MKAGDLVRVTHNCFDWSVIGWIGIITSITTFDDVYVFFPSGKLKFEQVDLEVISECG